MRILLTILLFAGFVVVTYLYISVSAPWNLHDGLRVIPIAVLALIWGYLQNRLREIYSISLEDESK